MKSPIFFMIALTALTTCQPGSAFAGHGEGNGGDAYVQEFTTIARKVEAYLVSRPATSPPNIDAEKFNNVINTVALSSVDDILYLDGVPKDLINYPRDNAIVISRPRWKSIIDSQKYSIVTHEILGVMGVDDRKYQVSWQLLMNTSMVVNVDVENAAGDPQSFGHWCTDAAGALQRALTAGYQAATSDQEKTLLLSGIQDALSIGSARFGKFFTATLNAALADMLVSSDPESQVYLLRGYVQSAIEDMNSFTPANNPNDNGPYVIQMLKRAIGMGALSKTNVEELNLLTRAAQRGILLIDSSDQQRTGSYACTRKALNDSLSISSDDSLTVQTQVLLLRGALSSASQMNVNCTQ